MAGRGRAPKIIRRNASDKPIRGEWQPTTAVGWQHGDIPTPPDGLLEESRETWRVWFGAWFAAHWIPGDVPMLRIVIRLYDVVRRGELVRAGELRQLMDGYGISPKGQQDRRWLPPGAPEPARPETSTSPYAHLRVIPEGDESA